MQGCWRPWVFLVQGQVQHGWETWREQYVGEREREGKMEGVEGGNREQGLLISGLWLTYLRHYPGQAPELIYVTERCLIFSNTNHSGKANGG